MSKDETTAVNLRNFPVPLHRELKSQAALNGRTLEQHIISILTASAKGGKK